MSFFKFFVERAKLVFLYYFNFIFPTNSFSTYQEKIVTYFLFQAVFMDLVDIKYCNLDSDNTNPATPDEVAKGFFLSFVRGGKSKPIPLEEMDF